MASEELLVLLGFGCNLGDRRAQLREAVQMTRAFLKDVRVSRVCETPALLPENAPAEWNIPFLNCCVAGMSSLPPEELLAHCKEIENALGRENRGVWSPREIDVDVLAIGDLVCTYEALRIPHPHLHKREFVLWPLADVAGDWRYPVGEHKGRTIREIIEATEISMDAITDCGVLGG